MNQTIKLPKLLGEGCVLQRGEQTRIWGWYKPQKKIVITFQEQSYEITSDVNGKFETEICCKKVGGPYCLSVKSEDGSEIVIKEVYVGDVFVCSGQSNMELPITRVREMFPDEPGNAMVHQYKVEECPVFTGELNDHKAAAWNQCVGMPLEETTALGYFFGDMIQKKEQVPVGIINISKGGTPVEAWMSEEALADYPEFLEVKERFAQDGYIEKLLSAQDKKENAWHELLSKKEAETDDAPWNILEVPGWFDKQGLENFSGLLHLKKTFEVPEELAGKSAILKMGTLVDSDCIFINGEKVGETGYCFPPRIYPIPEGLLKAGENEIFIRLECRDGKGRITPDKPCDVCFESGEKISLRGTWEYQVRVVSEQAPTLTFITRQPTGMYQGMVAPCTNMTVKGAMWYQGESNEWYPESYEDLIQKMILDWRARWKQDKLPFVIIQLPACGMDNRGDGAWAIIREAQKKADSLPEVAVTVNLDLGEYNDLHPLNKKGVAQRAYLAARKVMYQEEIICEGPKLISYKKTADGVEFTFDTQDGQPLEIVCGDSVNEFETAKADGVFYPAKAEIEGTKVKVFGEEIKKVRYAWKDSPLDGLLKNKEGLLTAPFVIEIK